MKQPSIYHLTGGYHVISLPGSKKAWAGNNRLKSSLFPDLLGKAMVFIFLAALATWLAPVLRQDTSSFLLRNQQATTGATRPTTGTPQTAREFSFEYSGLFYLRITITRPDPAVDLFFSSINITTSSKPYSHSSN